MRDEGIDECKSKTCELNMMVKFPFIIYPYGMNKVLTDNDVLILMKLKSGMYRTKIDGR